MNILITIVVAVALLGGGAFFLSGQGTQDATMEKDGEMMEEKSDVMEKDDAMTEEDAMMEDKTSMGGETMKSGSYEAYAPEKLVRADSGDVVLFFRAPWCPTCRALDADIKTNAGSIPESVTILDVDYDTATALKQKYGVTYQHTFVQVDSSGAQIAKWMGSPTLAALLGNVK